MHAIDHHVLDRVRLHRHHVALGRDGRDGGWVGKILRQIVGGEDAKTMRDGGRASILVREREQSDNQKRSSRNSTETWQHTIFLK